MPAAPTLLTPPADTQSRRTDAGHPPSLAFRPDIEGLRGIAVLLVVAYHAGVPGFSGGFVGVDVFFVLSGYLITGLLATEVEQTGRVDLPRFYARRARRLLPAAVLVLALTIAVGMWVYSPMEAGYPARNAVATSIYASNVYLRSALDYFAPAAERNPLLHTWSLSLEEQFYLVWPLVILLVGRRSRPRLTAGLAALTLVSLAACVWMTKPHPAASFYLMPPRAWEFGVGGLAWLLPAAWIGRRGAGALAWLATAAVLSAVVLLSPRTDFPGAAALLPVLGTAVLLAACAAHPAGPVARGLGTAAPRFLGRLSYSWYLWHWPVLVFATHLVPGLTQGERIAAVLLSLLPAWASYAWVERPLRENRRLLSRPWLTLLGAAVLTAVVLCAALAWYASSERQVNSPAMARYVAASKERSFLYRTGCIPGLRDGRLLECSFGDTTSAVTVVLLGDSHAAQWFPAVERAAVERGWKLVTMIKAGCPSARVPAWNPRLRSNPPQCSQWREAALRRIAELRPAAVVQSNWNGYVRHEKVWTRSARLTPEEWRDGVRGTLEAITAAGTPVLLVRSSPLPGLNVPACLARGGSCPLERDLALNPEAIDAETDAARGLPVSFLDLTDRFCGRDTCPTEVDGTIVYFDANHVTNTYAATLGPAFADAIAAVIGVPSRD